MNSLPQSHLNSNAQLLPAASSQNTSASNILANNNIMSMNSRHNQSSVFPRHKPLQMAGPRQSIGDKSDFDQFKRVNLLPIVNEKNSSSANKRSKKVNFSGALHSQPPIDQTLGPYENKMQTMLIRDHSGDSHTLRTNPINSHQTISLPASQASPMRFAAREQPNNSYSNSLRPMNLHTPSVADL